MTPYELALHIECAYERKEADLKDSLSLVWMGEYYHRNKKLPSLKDELRKISSQEKQPMTRDEMLAMVHKLNAQFGGSVIKGSE